MKKLIILLLIICPIIMIGQTTRYFSSYCSGCQGNADTALANAFAATGSGDILEFDTDTTLTYNVTNQLTILNGATINFHNTLLKRANGVASFYGDILVQPNATINDLNWDGNRDNNGDGSIGFGVKTAIAPTGTQDNITFNGGKIANTIQMAMSNSGVSNFTVDGMEFANIGEHVFYFTQGWGGVNHFRNIICGEFGVHPDNAGRNVEFIKAPDDASSETTQRFLTNITFNMPSNPGGSIRNIISNTVFEGEIWDNITASNAVSFYALYATDDPSTLTIKNSDFGTNDILLRVVGQVVSQNNYQNASANTIANRFVIENTTAAWGRITTAISSWSGGKMYIRNPKEFDALNKKGYAEDVLFCDMDIELQTSMDYYDFSGNVTFNGVNFIANGSSTLNIGSSDGDTGTVRFKNTTGANITLSNGYGGTISVIAETTNTNTYTNGGTYSSFTTGVASTGGVDCAIGSPPEPEPSTPVSGNGNMIFLINN